MDSELYRELRQGQTRSRRVSSQQEGYAGLTKEDTFCECNTPCHHDWGRHFTHGQLLLRFFATTTPAFSHGLLTLIRTIVLPLPLAPTTLATSHGAHRPSSSLPLPWPVPRQPLTHRAWDRAPALCTAVTTELCEDEDIAQMLKSSVYCDLRAGDDVLCLAMQGATAETWVNALRLQCLLNYQKSPFFSDQQITVKWADGISAWHSITDKTSATVRPEQRQPEPTRRLPDCSPREPPRADHECRPRMPTHACRPACLCPLDYWELQALARQLCTMRNNKDRDEMRHVVRVESDPTAWALFEQQCHESDAPTSSDAHVTTLRRLRSDESVLDVLLRWEQLAREIYGTSPQVPEGSFALMLRKVKHLDSGTVRSSSKELLLEFGQARGDFLDGRLNAVLGEVWDGHRYVIDSHLKRTEILEIASLLVLTARRMTPPASCDRLP